MEGQRKYTVIELAELLQVPRTTVNDWLARHSQFIEVLSQGKRKVYTDASANVLREIMEMRNSGLSSFEIDGQLSKRHPVHLEEVAEEKIGAEDKADPGKGAASPQESQLIIRNSMSEMGEMIRKALMDMNRRMDELENFNSRTVRKANRWYLLSLCIFIAFVAACAFSAYRISRYIEENARLEREKMLSEGSLRDTGAELAESRTDIGRLISDKEKLSSEIQEQKASFEKHLAEIKDDARKSREAEMLRLRDDFAKERLSLLKSLDEAGKTREEMQLIVARLQQQCYEQGAALRAFSEKSLEIEEFKKDIEKKILEEKKPAVQPEPATSKGSKEK